ncbi:PREDICTED: nucleosome assembly protein 1-like 3 [Bactrocera latifrons]|uniref:nucleosome assembly protein 1-like 3 n=1 Tax=Bactrocera latifrons TaxID=174628 RepID=UPI0008DD5832|nr:PREDICTED: nucleosome assembly protein 1-like 3 [Bactrocera latifrons]
MTTKHLAVERSASNKAQRRRRRSSSNSIRSSSNNSSSSISASNNSSTSGSSSSSSSTSSSSSSSVSVSHNNSSSRNGGLDVDLSSDQRQFMGIGTSKLTTIGSFTTSIDVDNIKLEVKFPVVRERDIKYALVIGNDVLRQVDMFVTEDGEELRQKKVEEKPPSKEEVNTGAVRKDRTVGSAKPKKFDVKLNVAIRVHEDDEQYMGAVRKYRKKIRDRRALEAANNESEGAVVAKEPREFRISEASSKLVHETAEMGTDARNNPIDEGDNRIAELSEEFGTLCMVAGMAKVLVDEADLSHLNKEQATVVRRMVANYKPTSNSNSPVEMKILLSDDTPVYENPRRMSYTDRQEVNEQVKEWLKDGIIKSSNSNYASPVVLVSKKYGKKRLCCDYRR